MPKGWKALPMKAYLTDYTERIKGLNPTESLQVLRELEEDTLLSIRNGNATKILSDAEFKKDNANDLKASRRLIDLQYKRLEKIYSPLKEVKQ